ncbi:hypothetical protein LWI29_011342 [Acer saccharum]|uniref:Uncharacterized protein n=1 Tax=Acer saccharum TaxID=4024 RepID=A0AA39VX11_ACESA|nr:hypothetical protein LWI29_011342 [Acer saccharum]
MSEMFKEDEIKAILGESYKDMNEEIDFKASFGSKPIADASAPPPKKSPPPPSLIITWKTVDDRVMKEEEDWTMPEESVERDLDQLPLQLIVVG